MAEQARVRGQATVHIDAPPEKVWELVSDVTRMGDWSPECYRCEWQGGASGPATGASFRGWNKQGIMRWSTTATVKVADPGREFTFETGKPGKESTRWSYKLQPADSGTDVTESFEALRYGFFSKLIKRPEKRAAKLGGDVQQTLERIKAALDGNS